MVSKRPALFLTALLMAPLLMATLLSGLSSAVADDIDSFEGDSFEGDFYDGDSINIDRVLAVDFLRPLFPLLDCESVGAVSKGEVDEHFSEIFYLFAQRRAFDFEQYELKQSLANSSDETVSTLFAGMDIDASGVVSTTEFREFMYNAIDLADADNNGRVTLADLGLKEPGIIRAHQR